MWDFSIESDHVIEALRWDLVVVDQKRTCKIIDFAVPGDSRIAKKEKDRKDRRRDIERYQELKREWQKIWNVRGKIMPLVVDCLGAIPKQFGNRFKGTNITVEQLEY